MTSSLVGSEMCIRDSPRAMAVRSLSLYQKVQLLAAEPLEWKASRYIPVSYTHLTLPTICSV
eukprot:2670176-Prorocentrum_lima.AAC.1